MKVRRFYLLALSLSGRGLHIIGDVIRRSQGEEQIDARHFPDPDRGWEAKFWTAQVLTASCKSRAMQEIKGQSLSHFTP